MGGCAEWRTMVLEKYGGRTSKCESRTSIGRNRTKICKVAPHSLKIAHQTTKVTPSSMDRKSMLHAISESGLDSCLNE